MDFAMKTPNGMLDPKKLVFPVLLQPKLDGLRGLAVVGYDGSVTWYSYSGKPLWNLEYVTQFLPDHPGVYDGEIIWPGRPFSDAYGLCKRQKPDPKKYPDHEKDKLALQFHVFDFLHHGEWSSKECERPLRLRLSELVSLIETNPGTVTSVPTWMANDLKGFHEYHRMFLDKGYEGTMVKKLDGLYWWKRHPDWHRWKPTDPIDVLILEQIEGKGKWKGALGAFVVQMPDGTRCKAGGGRITLETRKEWWSRNLVGKYVEVLRKPGKKGAMREPILVRLREDK